MHPYGLTYRATSSSIEPQRTSQHAPDPDNVPSWYANISSVEWKTPRPVQVGSRIAFDAHFRGRRIAYTNEIVESIPGEHLLMRTAEEAFFHGVDLYP